jgi:hypothetical protein
VISKREAVISAVRALIAAALPAAEVKRNLAKSERIPPGGLVVVRDGEPGEPDTTLSPLTYHFEHRIALEVAANDTGGTSRELALDAMLRAIGTAIAANRTLGGLCDWIEAEAPATDDAEALGAVPVRFALLTLVAAYATTDPLN